MCVIFPSLSLAFDIGRCPQHAIWQDFLFISHAHLDHIGGLPMYVATRGLFRMRPPTIFVPEPDRLTYCPVTLGRWHTGPDPTRQ
jgi:ribonuclease Z